MITIYILQTDKLDLSLIDARPFGDAEKQRLLAIKNKDAANTSLSSLGLPRRDGFRKSSSPAP